MTHTATHYNTLQHPQQAHPALIFHPGGSKLCNDIQLQDPTLGSVLDLKIDYDVSAWGDTTVVVYPPYILCNHSEIPLVFGQVSADLVGGSQVRQYSWHDSFMNNSHDINNSYFLNHPYVRFVTGVSTHCNTLPHTATHCNTLQHTATHCNTLQCVLPNLV